MEKVLVTYATMSGSTTEVANAVAEEIGKSGLQVEILPLDQVESVEKYHAVVLGAPMIMGWHRAALGFLKKNREAFRNTPLAVFVTAMNLTQTQEYSLDGVPVYVDKNLPKLPQKEGRLSFKERYASVSKYAAPILKAAAPAKPLSIGFFGGRLELYRLKWWAVLFVMLVIQAQPGDRRNWEAIREWAGSLPEKFASTIQ